MKNVTTHVTLYKAHYLKSFRFITMFCCIYSDYDCIERAVADMLVSELEAFPHGILIGSRT